MGGKCPKGYTNLGAKQCKKAATGDKELGGKNDSKAKNLKACIGECDADSQCAKGLKCFQRSKGEKIPGCKGKGGGATWDYCYKPVQKSAPKYTMAGYGKANCGKLPVVKTEADCRKVATKMKKPFGNAGGYGGYPKGCFVYKNKFYFNKAKTGKGNSKASPVCEGK